MEAVRLDCESDLVEPLRPKLAALFHQKEANIVRIICYRTTDLAFLSNTLQYLNTPPPHMKYDTE